MTCDPKHRSTTSRLVYLGLRVRNYSLGNLMCLGETAGRGFQSAKWPDWKAVRISDPNRHLNWKPLALGICKVPSRVTKCMGAEFDSKLCSLRVRNMPVPSYYIRKSRNATNFGTAKMIKQIPFFLSNSSSLFLRSSNSSTFLSKSFFSVSVRISFKISRRSRPRIFWFLVPWITSEHPQ